MPLVEAVLQQSRLDALTACDANLARYDPNSFLVIFRCRGRQMPFLVKPLLVLMIWSVAWLLIFERFEHFRDTIMPLEDLVTPLLTPVSFLLVFRLGRSAVRWWDARAAAGKLVEVCRSMASSASASCASQPELVDGIARWSCRAVVVITPGAAEPRHVVITPGSAEPRHAVITPCAGQVDLRPPRRCEELPSAGAEARQPDGDETTAAAGGAGRPAHRRGGR